MSAIVPYTALFPAGARGVLVVAKGKNRRHARDVAKLAAEIHARESVRVHVASVQVQPTGYAARFLRSISVRRVLEDVGRESMESVCQELDALGVPYRTHVEVGPWIKGIKKLAGELGCARVLLGSDFDAWLLRHG